MSEPASTPAPPAPTTSSSEIRVHADLHRDRDAADVVCEAVNAAIGTFQEHIEAAGRGDVRGVHQARVGLRRLRSHLRTFRRVVDIEWATALSAEASWLADSLGSIRDLDVLHARLVEGALLQVPEQAPAIRGLVSMLEAQREVALGNHLELRETARYIGLVGRLDEATREMPTRSIGEEPAAYLVPKLLLRTWRELRGAARIEKKDPSIEHLHTVRIRAKRMRYACEAATPVLGSAARRMARSSEALQERLGEWHDASAARAWLDGAARIRPDFASAAVRLASLESKAAENAAAQWGTDYRTIKSDWKRIDPSRKKNKKR